MKGRNAGLPSDRRARSVKAVADHGGPKARAGELTVQELRLGKRKVGPAHIGRRDQRAQR